MTIPYENAKSWLQLSAHFIITHVGRFKIIIVFTRNKRAGLLWLLTKLTFLTFVLGYLADNEHAYMLRLKRTVSLLFPRYTDRRLCNYYD